MCRKRRRKAHKFCLHAITIFLSLWLETAFGSTSSSAALVLVSLQTRLCCFLTNDYLFPLQPFIAFCYCGRALKKKRSSVIILSTKEYITSLVAVKATKWVAASKVFKELHFPLLLSKIEWRPLTLKKGQEKTLACNGCSQRPLQTNCYCRPLWLDLESQPKFLFNLKYVSKISIFLSTFFCTILEFCAIWNKNPVVLLAKVKSCCCSQFRKCTEHREHGK